MLRELVVDTHVKISLNHQADVLLVGDRRFEGPASLDVFRVIKVILLPESRQGHLDFESEVVRALLFDRKVEKADWPLRTAIEYLHEVWRVLEVLKSQHFFLPRFLDLRPSIDLILGQAIMK